MQKLCLILPLVALATCAWARVPTKGNAFFGYSYDHTAISTGDNGSLNGWEGSLEGKMFPYVGLVMDIDGHYGSRDYSGLHADVTAHNVLFGPRVSVQVSRFRPFGELLLGVGHVSLKNGVSDSDTSFANAVGGGVDYRLVGPVALRGQLDWIETRFFGHTQNGTRFSTGISIHF